MEGIEKYRKKIDLVDLKLFKLIEKRIGFSREIGKLKRANNIPIQNNEREASIQQGLKTKSTLKGSEIDDICNIIFKISKQNQ